VGIPAKEHLLQLIAGESERTRKAQGAD